MERMATASCAAEPSSGTAMMSRTTLAPSWDSRMAMISSSRMLSSAKRKPASAGVSGVGMVLPASIRYRRWSVNSANTSVRPAVTVHAPPPYSCTLVRAFHGAGKMSIATPSRWVRTAYRPASLGRASSHQMSSPTQVPPLIGWPLSARSRAEIGERQEPYGATVIMETILP